MSLLRYMEQRYVKAPLVWPDKVEARLYQQAIAEKACKKNTLVVLPTALGKTIISALAAVYFLYNHKQMRVLVMAPTRPLVLQHRETYMSILQLSDEDAVALTGKTPSAYRKQIWDGKARIIFATPQVVKNDLESGSLSMKNFSFLVFDECHRARKEYAYTDVAKKYVEEASWPIILGMTASPGADKKKIGEICEALFIEQIEYRSEEDPDVVPYINPIEVEWKYVDLPSEYREISRTIRSMLNDRLDWLNRIGVIHGRPEYVTRRDLLEAGEELRYRLEETIEEERGPIYSAIVAQSASLTLFHALELLETQGIPTLTSFLDRMEQESEEKKSYKTIINDPRYIQLKSLLNQNMKLEHPKTPLLKEEIENQLKQHPNSKVLVFTQYRDTASHLVGRLRETGQLSVERFVGQASKQDDPGLSQDEQAEILTNFRNGDTNIIVATSVHPDEFIILQNPEGSIEIERIGEFVDSFLGKRRCDLPVSKEISGWMVLSFDGVKNRFLPISAVHKHKRLSKTVNVKLKCGFETMVTEDHSLFSFNGMRQLMSTRPQNGKFAALMFDAPNPEYTNRLDLAKQLLIHAPRSELDKVYCTIDGLTQPKVRMLKSELKFLETINSKSICLQEIAQKSGLDPSTVTNVCQRLLQDEYVTVCSRDRRVKLPVKTDKGMRYGEALDWLFRNYVYRKSKYVVRVESIFKCRVDPSEFFRVFLEVKYGQVRLPRYLDVNDGLAQFLGFYVSEGSISFTEKKMGVFLAARDEEVREMMTRSVIDGLHVTPTLTANGVAVTSYLVALLVKYVFKCGTNAQSKEIPSMIFTSPMQQKISFLKAYFIGDGYGRETSITFTTVSRKLATGLIFLLRQLGIRNVTLGKEARLGVQGMSCMYRVYVYEATQFFNKVRSPTRARSYYSLVPTALVINDTYLRFGNMYFKDGGLAYAGGKQLHSRIAGRVCAPVHFDYISEVHELEEQPEFVYDLSVPSSEMFYGGLGQICLHNSIAEEGLDIPAVDLVVFYEPIPSEIRYIQRKGRTGRKTAGKAVILAANDTFDIAYLYASRRRVERMRKITASLNQELNPLMRLGPKPEPNPLTVDEMREMEKHAKITRLEPQLIKPEEEKVKKFLRDVDKASRYIWTRAMKAGSQGLLIEDLADQIAEEGVTPAILKAAVEKLQDIGQLQRIGWDRIAPVPSKPTPQKDMYDILVEKIYPGKAVVLINDKWRARITPQDFEGPSNIFKKDARFKARGMFYHDGDTLCFRVREVIQLLS